MKGVVFFHNFGFLIRSSHTALASSFTILRNWRSSYEKVFPVLSKVAKRKFLCSNVQSLKVVGTKMSGLLMFSEIGNLPARKKLPLLGPGSEQRL